MNTYQKHCRWGQFLLIHGDMISEFVNLYGEWCEGEVELFRQLLPEDGVVVEVGSNIGMHSIPMSQFCDRGKVFCFEPQRIVFQILCANIALNNRLNVFARQCAVGGTEETIDIQSGDYDRPWNYGAFSLTSGFSAEMKYTGAARMEKVGVVVLDQDPGLKDIGRLDFLKIDAEGFETFVLRGAREIIGRFRPFIFIENNAEKNFDSVLSAVRALGYQCYWYCSARHRPNNYNGAFWKLEGFDMNMLCVPDGNDSVRGASPRFAPPWRNAHLR